MPQISSWKETLQVIGVKEDVPPSCQEVVCGTNSSTLVQLSIICSYGAPLCLFSQLLASMPSCLGSHPRCGLSSTVICLLQSAGLMNSSSLCQSCAPRLSYHRWRHHSSVWRRQLQLQNATEGFRNPLDKHSY